MTFQEINPQNFDYAGSLNNDFFFRHKMGDDFTLQELHKLALRDSQFTKAVLDMRNKQKVYFQLKTAFALEQAKQAEALVDKYLEMFINFKV